MTKSRELGVISILMILPILVISGCGPRVFTRGEYDDPNRVELLDDKFNESDLQQLADAAIKGFSECAYVAKAKTPPYAILETIENRTEEHIDTVALATKIRNTLTNAGKVEFINKKERGTLKDEYEYNKSQFVSKKTQKVAGKQIGADVMVSGELVQNIQEVGGLKYTYFKFNAIMTDLETSAIKCSVEKEIRKKFKKRSVGI